MSPSGRRRLPDSVATRIAVAAIAVAAVALAILAGGVILIGSQTFAALMAEHGFSTASSDEMFRASVIQAMLVAAAVAVVAAVVLAAVVAARVARPLQEIGAAARRIAEGQFETRIPGGGPDEIESLAESFNAMALALARQEEVRREFIANAAHELRTPLTNLQGYLEGLRDGVIPPDRDTFESLWEETDRLVRLARALDTLAGSDVDGPPALVELDLVAAVRSAVGLARPAAASGSLDLADELPGPIFVRADSDQLAEILGNLLHNALRYTPADGRIVVRVAERLGEARVEVENSGPGIPAEDLPHVFERFYRVDKSRDRARGGAGIGLAIVRQLVEGFGGRVGAESAAGRTVVWFELPVG